MAPVTMPPVEEARSIFQELGYTVSGQGTDLLAERKWRTVHVTATTTNGERALADGGRTDHKLRCFVTWTEYAGELRNRLAGMETPYEWAVIGVGEDSSYEVV